MAKNILTNLNLGYNEVLNLRVENRDAPPVNPQEGTMYYDTTAGAYRLFQAGEWFELASFGGGGSAPVITINHGADNTVPRPDAEMVIWRGTVEPLYWTNDDIWHDEEGTSGGTGDASFMSFNANGDHTVARPSVPISTTVMWLNTPQKPTNIGDNDLWEDLS